MAWRFSEPEVRAAISDATCWADALRALGLRAAGGNHRTIQKYAARWSISTDHFDPAVAKRRAMLTRARPIEEILVADSNYSRGTLKRRLYASGLKERRCELCGQDESWRGAYMALVLDHINGDARDNRLENLRIACPNCAATFDTHCGRNFTPFRESRACETCQTEFYSRHAEQRFCSPSCGYRSPRRRWDRRKLRKVERPPYDQLLQEVADTSWLAVGRKYGVSDNAVRKWARAYERELGITAGSSHAAVAGLRAHVRRLRRAEVPLLPAPSPSALAVRPALRPAA